MPRKSRLCPLCKTNQVENETHFLFQCSKYSLQSINRVNEMIPDIERKSTLEGIKLLMNSNDLNDYHVNKLVMKSISSSMNICDTLLLSSESDVT